MRNNSQYEKEKNLFVNDKIIFF